MRKALRLCVLLLMASGLTGCVAMTGGTDLSDVAKISGLQNITTGDGTFENYTATGYYTATDIGIAVGIPGMCKIVELFPVRSNEDLLGDVANRAKDDGADAMINVIPADVLYTGIPLFFLGVYVDKATGTGIDLK